MALNFYWANDLTGGGTGALDKIPTAKWVDKMGALVVKSSYLYAYECDDDLGGSESSPWLIQPDDENGNKRFNLLGAVFEDVKTKSLKLYDTDQSNVLSLIWNEGSAADYTLNLAVGGASRTLTVESSATVSQDYTSNARPTFNGIVVAANGVVGVTDGNPQIVFDNANNWLEITGKVGIGTATPQRLLHLSTSYASTITLLAFENVDTTDPTAMVHSFRGTTTGVGATTFVEYAAIAGSFLTHDHPTIAGNLKFYVASAGSLQIGLSVVGAAAQAQPRVGIGIDASLGAMLHIDQASTTAAIPVLTLDQGDIDLEFIKLIGSSEDGEADRSLVDIADMTTPGAQVGWFQIYVEDIQGTNPITDGVYYVPFYAAPSA